jgi:hypothetical protein
MPTQMPRKGLPRSSHLFFQGFPHAGNGLKPVAAVAEGADTRQYDALGVAHDVRIGGDANRLGDAALAGQRARTPFQPSADCRSRNR